MKKNKIAINTLSEDVENNSGSFDWFINILKKVPELDHSNLYYFCVSKKNFVYFRSPDNNNNLIFCGKSNENRLLRLLSEQIIIPIQLKRNRIDVFFTTSGGGVAPILMPKTTKLVIAVFGTQHLLKKSGIGTLRTFYRNFLGYFSLKRAKYIISNSSICKQEIINKYPWTESKIKIISHGFDSNYFNNSALDDKEISLLKSYKIGNPYFLFVSTIWRYKNLDTLIHAFYYIINEITSPFELIIIGRRDLFSSEEKDYSVSLDKLIERLGIKNRVRFLGPIRNMYLRPFYKQASAYIQPSYYETFGKTVVESMACGCPVLASNTGATPEIVGNAALLFNPYETKELVSCMVKIISNSILRNEKIEHGLNRAKDFSIDSEVREYKKLFISVLDV